MNKIIVTKYYPMIYTRLCRCRGEIFIQLKYIDEWYQLNAVLCNILIIFFVVKINANNCVNSKGVETFIRAHTIMYASEKEKE